MPAALLWLVRVVGLAPPSAKISQTPTRPRDTWDRAFSHEVHAPLFVISSTREQLRANLDHYVEVSKVELVSRMKPNLEVTDLRWAGPGLLGAIDSFGHDVGQEFT